MDKKAIKGFLALLLTLLICVLLAGVSSEDDIAIPAGFEGNYIDVSGFKIRYKQAGSGQDVLLIHGLPGSLEDWSPIMNRYASEYRFTAYDRPGQGFSSIDGVAFSINQNADVALGLIEKLMLKNVIVVGHSYGGSIIMNLALRKPSQIKAYIPIGGAVYPLESPDPVFYLINIPILGEGLAVIASKTIAESRIREGVHKAFNPNFKAIPKSFLQSRTPIWSQSKVIVATAKEEVNMNGNLEELIDRYPEIKKPFIVIQGKNDGLVPYEDAVKLHGELKNSELILLDNVGHQVQFVRPEIIKAAIDKMM
jgi:pimeloyl-ACP methyl ester carboxylesterase